MSKHVDLGTHFDCKKLTRGFNMVLKGGLDDSNQHFTKTY